MGIAIYMRVSTEEQQERGSIATQRSAAEAYCTLHQIDAAEYYADESVSGTVPLADRPQGQRLLEDARAGKVNVVLMWKLDRLGRDPRHTLNAVAELTDLGVEVRSMTEQFDTATPAGRFMLTIMSGVAGLERDTIIQRSVEGTNRLAREGAWLGGIVPFGYRVEGKKQHARLVISDEPLPGMDLSEADVIRLIYRLATEEGRSCVLIADHLNSLGIPPSYSKDGRHVTRGKRTQATAGIWRHGRVRNLLISSTYQGIHQYGKRSRQKRDVIERPVPAIVTPQQWESAQQTLRRNQRFSPRNARRKYLLRGLMKCAACECTYIGTANTGAGRKLVPYYKCNGRHQAKKNLAPDKPRCVAKSIRAQNVEDAIWEDVEEFLRNPHDVLDQLANQLQLGASRLEELEAELDRTIKILYGKENERNAILSLFRRERIDSSALDRQLDEIATDEALLRGQVDDLRSRIQSVEADGARLFSAESLLRSLNSTLDQPISWELKRQMIEHLVDHAKVATVHQHGEAAVEIEVVYRFGSIETCTGTGSSRPPA